MSTAPLQPSDRLQIESSSRSYSADHRLAGLEYLRRDFSDGRLEASAGQQALVGSILAHDDPRAFAAIGAPADPDHRGDRDALPCLPGVADRVNEALIFPAVHSHGRWHKRWRPGKQADVISYNRAEAR